jgi:hypothetical protein
VCVCVCVCVCVLYHISWDRRYTKLEDDAHFFQT